MAIGAGILVGSILGGIAKLLSVDTLKFVATRIMLYSLFTLVLPVVLYNVFSLIVNETLSYISSNLGSEGIEGTIIELTGVGAYLGNHLQLEAALALILSAVALRFTLSILIRR